MGHRKKWKALCPSAGQGRYGQSEVPSGKAETETTGHKKKCWKKEGGGKLKRVGKTARRKAQGGSGALSKEQTKEDREKIARGPGLNP